MQNRLQNEWILDVLTDLGNFARQNGMCALAEQIDDTKIVASAELVSNVGGSRHYEHSTASAAGHDSGGTGTHL